MPPRELFVEVPAEPLPVEDVAGASSMGFRDVDDDAQVAAVARRRAYMDYCSSRPISTAFPNLARNIHLRSLVRGLARNADSPHADERKRRHPDALPADWKAPLLPPQPADDHTAADAVFFASSEMSSRGSEIFVASEAGAGRVAALALCYYCNLRAATLAAVVALVFGVAGAVRFAAQGNVARLGGSHSPPPNAALAFGGLLLPTVAFFCALLAGHACLPWRARQRAWFAPMCLHQSRAALRARATAALPEFLLASRRVVLLASPAAFSQLMVIAEVATFACAASCRSAWRTAWPPPRRLDLLPLTRAPWLLVAQLLDACACAASVPLLPRARAAIAPLTAGMRAWDSPLGTPLCEAAALGAVHLAARAPLILLNAMYLASVLREREAILALLASPSLCQLSADEADRPTLLALLARLAGAAPEEKNEQRPHEQQPQERHQDTAGAAAADELAPRERRAIERWLAAALPPVVEEQLGKAGRLSLGVALLAVLPSLCWSVATALGCGGKRCGEAAEAAGYGRAETYLAVRALALPLTMLAAPLAAPLAMGAVHMTRSSLGRCGCTARPLEELCAVLATAASYALVSFALIAPPLTLLEPAAAAGHAAAPLLATFGGALAAACALHAICFGAAAPKSVLALSALAVACVAALVAARAARGTTS